MALVLNNLKRVDMPLNKETETETNDSCSNLNVTAWRKFEPTYFNVTVQQVNHYFTGTSPDEYRDTQKK